MRPVSYASVTRAPSQVIFTNFCHGTNRLGSSDCNVHRWLGRSIPLLVLHHQYPLLQADRRLPHRFTGVVTMSHRRQHPASKTDGVLLGRLSRLRGLHRWRLPRHRRTAAK